jgi:anti-sigma factor RsiW
MTQKRWNTTEVSTYLDGALDPREQVAFETQMGQDPALQRRVEEMRQVVALVQTVPLRQPSRNYLLTPSMVTERKQVTKTRRPPLLIMRLATSLVAVAFVISFSLNVLQSSNLLRGALSPMSQAQPEAALLRDGGAGDAEESLAPEAPLVALEAEAPEVIATQSVEEPAALAAPPLAEELAERVAEGEVLGMGEVVSDELTVEGAESMLGVLAAPEEEMVEEDAAVEALKVPEVARQAPPADNGAYESVAEEEITAMQAVDDRRTTISPWITAVLGLATAILAAISIWQSRRGVG